MDDYNKSNVDDNSNSDISSEVNEQDNSTSDNAQSGNEQSNDNGIGNGYNQLASSNREAFTKGLNQNYADRIARNKANLEQARARSRETQKTNNKGEQQDKNGLDKVKDQANILKNKASLLSTKIDSARAGAYKAMHPVEAAKIAAKEAIKRKIITIALSSLAGCAPFLLGVFVILIAVFVVLGIFNTDISANTGSNIQESGFTISLTSLSKSEFTTKLEEFAIENQNFQIFVDNADGIYEYAKSKRVNPELVPIRAYVEDGGSTSGTNNYWGMGCTNEGGKDACYDYTTFEEGYISFIDNVSQYSSLADMMSKYAYIGKYWYNPGASDIGGCYYAKYIYNDTNMPDRVKKACSSSASKCSIENNTDCVATTDEDQTAYATWQVEIQMSDARLKIFGLEFNEGPTTYGTGNIQHLSSYNLNGNNLKVLNRSLTTSEMENLNDYINSEVDKAGYGTGAGVAAAGQALTYWLENQGYYLQYFWGGGHGGYGDSNTTFVGANPNWGKTGYNNGVSTGPYFGMDCSGFVSWAIRTACSPNYGSKTTWDMSHGPSIDISKAKAGDLMLDSDSHVRLVVKNNGDGTVITAEETISGLVFTKRNSEAGYKFIDMSSYYQKNCLATRQ